MKYLIVGLGNPGEEYKNSRHNVGRIILEKFAKANSDVFSDWRKIGKANAICTEGEIGKNNMELVMPETFMNNSGVAVSYLKDKEKIKSENIIVVYDDLDLGLGDLKISFNKSSGGHKGLESIIKKIKTKEFVRIRIGISSTTPTGKIKKPKGEQKVLDWVMSDFKKQEVDIIKKVSKRANEAIMDIIENGRVSAMNKFN